MLPKKSAVSQIIKMKVNLTLQPHVSPCSRYSSRPSSKKCRKSNSDLSKLRSSAKIFRLIELSLLCLFTCCATGSRMDSIVLVWNTGMAALGGRPKLKAESPSGTPGSCVAFQGTINSPVSSPHFTHLNKASASSRTRHALSQAPPQCYRHRRRRLRFQLCVGPGDH